LLLALSVGSGFAGIPLPQINTNHVVNVANYGAVGDGVATNTTAIQNAINAAAAGGTTNGLGGGTVEIPAGVYLCGALTVKSFVNLQIDAGATLQMMPYGTFPATSDFISGSNLRDIEISGAGTIDGQGAIWWATNNATSGGIARPKAMFAASTCTNILVRDVTLQNPPNTHISFRYVCVNVTIDHIDINTPNGTPNTDGIDCSGANVLIENCHISDGDDHVAMGDGHVGQFNHDITITNCLLGTGHGISIGSYTQGGLSNLLVINCVWTNGSAGIKAKSDIDRGGLVQNLRYLNLAMTNTQIPIYFSTYYTNSGTSSGVGFAKAASYPVFPVTGTTPIYRNITISNLTAVPASGYSAGIIWGRPELAISNVVLDHVNITASKYFDVYNARGIQFLDSQITATTITNFGLFNADLIVTNRSTVTNRVFLDGITTNGFGNSLSFYNAQASLSNTNALDDGPLTLAASTFTVTNNLSLTPSTVFNYTLGTNTAAVAIKGNLQLGGTVNVFPGSGFTNGTYVLMTYSGALSGNLPTLGSVPSNYNCVFDTNTAGQVKLEVPSLVATNVSFQRIGNQLQLAWPADHTSWRLEAQTNSLSVGLSTNWSIVPGSASTNQMTFPLDPGNASVLFRLAYP
jgi:polygalacturonase